ncbi:MAG: tRNA (adenosine(37)-N6)-dimethylallyltransferase MiaA [Rikenellaceae bacterium]
MNQDLICILGPTASGKTKYAVGMAFETDGEIISADSRQVYRGMDIGTGKDLADYTINDIQIPYHLIDIANAGEKYNLFQYQKDFRRVYNDIRLRGKQPILCGGTGLYIDAVTRGYSLAEVPENPQLRCDLENLSMEELISKLASMKKLHNKTDIDSKKRVIRALEIEIFRQNCPVEYIKTVPTNTRFIGISVSREERVTRIDKRLRERLEHGMIEEVKKLMDSGISPEDLMYYGLEYKFVTLYLLGKLTYEEMEKQLSVAIHQFAKRQMTWFRGMERRGVQIEWIENRM